MDMMHHFVMLSRLDLVVHELVAVGIDFRRLPLGFWNIGVFIEQRGGSGGTRGGHNPPGCTLVGATPLDPPLGALLAHWMSSGPKKSSRSFAELFDIDFL